MVPWDIDNIRLRGSREVDLGHCMQPTVQCNKVCYMLIIMMFGS